jgi:hypothetical protein
VRLHAGNYAYELLPIRERGTQVVLKWEYRIYRTWPQEELLHISPHPLTREKAVHEAKQMVRLYDEIDNVRAA